MQLSQWFHHQLQTSTEGFLRAVEQIPQERQYLHPKPDKWSAARIIYHMVRYDQLIGLPTLHQWVGGLSPRAGLTGSAAEDAAGEEANWRYGDGHDVQAMIAAFNKLRADQLALIRQFPEPAWSEAREAIWGSVTLQWAVTKTYQHTLATKTGVSYLPIHLSGWTDPGRRKRALSSLAPRSWQQVIQR